MTPNVQLERGLPVALDAERSVLGSILLDNEHIYAASERLQVEDFATNQHQTLFSAMQELAEAGRAIDIVTLRQGLTDAKRIESIGGIAYLASLTENMPRRPAIDEYLAIVADKAMSRRVIATCSSAITQAAEQAEPADELCSWLEAELMTMRAKTHDSSSIVQQSLEAWKVLESEATGELTRFYSYGIRELDERVNGLARGEMTVCAGWPGQGKTALVKQLAQRHCSGGTPMLVISPEMTAEQFLRRLWADVARVPFRCLRDARRLTQAQWACLEEARKAVEKWPLHIDSAKGTTPQQAAARAKLFKMRHGVEIVAVDYLQKLRYPGKPGERAIEIGDAAVTFANLAKYEQLAVLVLSSLTEPSGKARGTAPSLGDMRWNGDIQYEASTALLIHRPVDGETNHVNADGDIIIAKGRSDGTGTVPIRFNGDYLRFEDRAVGATARGADLAEPNAFRRFGNGRA